MPFTSLHVIRVGCPQADSGTVLPSTSGFEEHVRPLASDWTDEELVVLTHIQATLKHAGVQLELERGTTDEGDPWLAFCTAEGDVFVHICRIGPTYLIDSANLYEPLHGLNVASVVQRFVERTNTWSAALGKMQARLP